MPLESIPVEYHSNLDDLLDRDFDCNVLAAQRRKPFLVSPIGPFESRAIPTASYRDLVKQCEIEWAGKVRQCSRCQTGSYARQSVEFARDSTAASTVWRR